MISYILALITGAAVFGLDRYTKILTVAKFPNGPTGESTDIIKGIIDFTYVRNGGSAWGMLSGKTWILISLTVVVMLVCIALLLKYGSKNKLLFWAISLVIFGGLGNMYDRIFDGGEVVDFIHFTFFPQFPVFNVADCAIVIGAGLLILYFVIDMLKEARAKREVAEVTKSENEKG